MTSPCSSSSSSRHDRPIWKPPGNSRKKASQSVNDYINSYLTENLLKPQLRHLNNSSVAFSQSNSDGEVPSRDRSENPQRTKMRNKTEAKRISDLTKEMDKMLSRVKSKRQTNDILQLFKNTLNNFIIPEHPMDNNNNGNTHLRSELTKENQTVLPMSSGYHRDHYHVQSPQETNEIHPYEQNLFPNRETSVSVTSTLTRRNIKEPRNNTLESSKTNILHRCYGKQSVKALPQIHKSRKKNNNSCTNASCQRPHVLKSKSQKLPKQQIKIINQQMKTIYENEQFDKSEKLIPENLEDTSELIICDSTSHSSVETDKMSVIGTQISNEICNDKTDKLMQNGNKLETTNIDEWPSKSKIKIESEETNDKIKIHQSIIMKMNSEQDNSIVQRLTSFWNKKLNSSEQNKSTSDPSIVNSSLTSVLEEEGKEYEHVNHKCSIRSYNHKTLNNKINELDNDSLMNNESSLVRDNVRNASNNNNNKEFIKNSFSGSETKNDGCKQLSQNIEIPELKAGLMDELLTVLRSSDYVVSKHKKVYNNDKVKQNTNFDQNGMHSELNHLISERFHHSAEIDSTGDIKSEYSVEYNIDTKVNDNSDIECSNNEDDCDNVSIDDEQTFEVIERCLLENMTNEDKSCVKNQFDIILEEPAINIIKIHTLSNDFDDGMVKNEIEGNEKNYFTYQVEKNYDEINYNLNDHCAVITNVNCIIKNLKELICTIESIPEELKSVDMNLNSLPIPDKIKRKISSLIVSPNIESKHSKLSITKPLDGIDSQLKLLIPPAEKNQLFRCCSSGKLLGYSKKEGYICTLYFPKLLTKPVIQNIKNPIQKVLFPKRSDYLKIKASKFNYMNRLDKINENSDTVKKDYEDKIEHDKADFTSNNNDESVIIQENYVIFEENLLQKNNGIDKEEQIIGDCISATTKIKPRSTQSSIFYVTPPPNSIVMQLLPSNEPEDECYAKLKGTLSNKFFETTPVVYNKTLQNTKSNLKLEENFFIENNSVNNSVEELSDGMSIFSYTPSNGIQPDEFTVNDVDSNVLNKNIDCFPDESNILREEIVINMDENRHTVPNDLGLPSRRCGRIRRNRLHNNLDNDNVILNGGSGDSMHNCGDSIVSTAIPCHQTSSMSVIVSNSINDSTSQPDINIVESEYNLSRSRINLHCNAISRSVSPQDFDSFSICNVIQEEDSDEQLSEIDDFFMIKEQSSKVEINKTISDTVSTASILSQNTDLSNNLVHHEQNVPEEMVTCNKSSDHINNELSCNNQFTFQNLKNQITEETSLMKHNLSNNVEHNADNLGNERCDGYENCKNRDDKNFFFESVLNFEGNTDQFNKIISSQQELELPVTSFMSENINASDINVMNLSHSNLSINKNSSITTDNNDDTYSDKALLNLISSNAEDETSELESKKAESVKNIIMKKNCFFQQSYHTLYFETDFSSDDQKAMADKIIISSNKNEFDKMLENDSALKKKLSEIVDIDNLCEKEKQMMAACIYLTSQKFCDKSSTSFNTSKHNLSLPSGMNTLWDISSHTMFLTISFAKKSLMPYDFETETLLYRRRYRKLRRAFYSLFVSLLLVFVMQKHIFGIILPVCFPW